MVGVIIGVVVGVSWVLTKLSPKLKWLGRNGNGKQRSRECPILDTKELQEISRAKLERLKEHSGLLREICSELKDQRTAHAVMLERLERNR